MFLMVALSWNSCTGASTGANPGANSVQCCPRTVGVPAMYQCNTGCYQLLAIHYQRGAPRCPRPTSPMVTRGKRPSYRYTVRESAFADSLPVRARAAAAASSPADRRPGAEARAAGTRNFRVPGPLLPACTCARHLAAGSRVDCRAVGRHFATLFGG